MQIGLIPYTSLHFFINVYKHSSKFNVRTKIEIDSFDNIYDPSYNNN